MDTPELSRPDLFAHREALRLPASKVVEKLVEIVTVGDAVLGAKRCRRCTRAAVADGKPEVGAVALNRTDQGAAPAAKTDNAGADHFFAASMSRTPRNAR